MDPVEAVLASGVEASDGANRYMEFGMSATVCTGPIMNNERKLCHSEMRSIGDFDKPRIYVDYGQFGSMSGSAFLTNREFQIEPTAI